MRGWISEMEQVDFWRRDSLSDIVRAETKGSGHRSNRLFGVTGNRATQDPYGLRGSPCHRREELPNHPVIPALARQYEIRTIDRHRHGCDGHPVGGAMTQNAPVPT